MWLRMHEPSLPLLSSPRGARGAQAEMLDPLAPASLRDEVEPQLRAGGGGLHDGEQAIVPARSDVGLELRRVVPDLDVERGPGASDLLVDAAAATARQSTRPIPERTQRTDRVHLVPARHRHLQDGDHHRLLAPPRTIQPARQSGSARQSGRYPARRTPEKNFSAVRRAIARFWRCGTPPMP